MYETLDDGRMQCETADDGNKFILCRNEKLVMLVPEEFAFEMSNI